MLSRAAASLLTLLLVCAPAPSAAKPAGTLDRLADDLDARLGAALGDRALGELDLGLAVRPLGGTPDRLGQVIGRLMLERIRARKPRSLTLAPGGLDEAGRRAWTTARGLELILEVDVMLGTGHLHLVGMLRECDRHLWRDLITPQRGALNHLHASVRMDAEVRAYQGAVSSGSLRLSAETFPVQVGGGILALASADLDGDGRAELLALQSRTLLVLRYLGPRKGLSVALQHPLGGQPATIRPRRPMGTLLALDRDGDRKPELLLRSSEQARGEILSMESGGLSSRGELDGYPLAGDAGSLLTCAARPGQDQLDGAAARILPADGAAPAPATGLPAAFYALRQAPAPVQKKDEPGAIRALVDSEGVLTLQDPRRGKALGKLRGVGAALHLVDLNDDGALELITSGGGGPGEDDLLRIHKVAGGKLSGLLWSSAGLPGAVTALAHGDLDGDGKLELVAALLNRAGAARLMVLR